MLPRLPPHKEFDNRGFTLKTNQMFSVLTSPEQFENTTISVRLILHLYLSKTRAEEYHDYRNAIVYEKLRFRDRYCGRKA